jgi:hypothetical protein
MLMGIFGKYPNSIQITLSIQNGWVWYLHYDNSFLHNIADSCANELQQDIDTSFSTSLDFDGCLTDGLDTLPHKVYIDLGCISVLPVSMGFKNIKWWHSLFQLAQQRVYILLGSKPDHDIQLLDLDIQRVIIFTEEDAHLVREEICSFLEKEVNVSESDPLDFGWGGEEGDEGRSHFADELFDEVFALDAAHVDHYYLQ